MDRLSPLESSFNCAVGEYLHCLSQIRMAWTRRGQHREAVHRAVMSPSAMDGVTIHESTAREPRLALRSATHRAGLWYRVVPNNLRMSMQSTTSSNGHPDITVLHDNLIPHVFLASNLYNPDCTDSSPSTSGPIYTLEVPGYRTSTSTKFTEYALSPSRCRKQLPSIEQRNGARLATRVHRVHWGGIEVGI